MCCSAVQILGSTKSVHDTEQFKSFSHFLCSCWALSPLKHFPPLFIHRSQCFFQFWKYSWYASFGILHKSASDLFNRLKLSSFQYGFLLGARCVKYGGWETSGVSCFVRKSQIRREKCARACHVGATIFFPSINQAFFSSLPSDNVPCSPPGHEVEIHDKLLLHNTKTQSASLPHWTKLPLLFWVWVTLLRPIAKTGLLFQYHSHKPKFHHL